MLTLYRAFLLSPGYEAIQTMERQMSVTLWNSIQDLILPPTPSPSSSPTTPLPIAASSVAREIPLALFLALNLTFLLFPKLALSLLRLPLQLFLRRGPIHLRFLHVLVIPPLRMRSLFALFPIRAEPSKVERTQLLSLDMPKRTMRTKRAKSTVIPRTTRPLV